MDNRTGQIHEQLPGESKAAMAARTGVPERNLIPLRRQPVAGCARCRGTGIKKITPHGRRIPCACTIKQTVPHS